MLSPLPGNLNPKIEHEDVWWWRSRSGNRGERLGMRRDGMGREHGAERHGDRETEAVTDRMLRGAAHRLLPGDAAALIPPPAPTR